MFTPHVDSSSVWTWSKSYNYTIPRASSSANCRQFFRSACVLLPLGHHCTLPRPISSRPKSSFPLRTSISSVLLLFSFVRSTEYGRNAVTLVAWSLRLRACAT